MKALLYTMFMVCVIIPSISFVFANEGDASWLLPLILSDSKPQIIGLGPSVSVVENETLVVQVNAFDDDNDDLTYRLTGTDAGSFVISALGVIQFKSAPDFESKTSYVVRVIVSDGSFTTRQALTIDITDVNEVPVITSSSSFSVNDGETSVGTVTTTDPEDNSVSYSLGGTDSDLVAINSVTGVLILNVAADLETKSSYSVTVTATDGTNSITQSITITITEPPTAISASYSIDLKPQVTNSYTIQLTGTVFSGRTASYLIVTNGTFGTASVDSSTGVLSYSTTSTDIVTEQIVFKVNDGFVDSEHATISIEHKSDPLYQHQWHLDNSGQTNFASNAGTAGQDLNVDTVIAGAASQTLGYTGSGIVVAVVDEGLELAHEDLSENIVPGSYDFLNSDTDPTNAANDGDHGTSVAGIIASRGWNNIGGRGVAPHASLLGYNYLKNQTISNQVKSWGIDPPVTGSADLYNLSYGRGYGSNTTYVLPTLISSAFEDALISGVETLRDNKGAIYIKSAGNAYDDHPTSECGTDLSCTDTVIDSRSTVPYIMLVGALNADGVKASYSPPGASIWVSGFGGQTGFDSTYVTSSGGYDPAIMTTDQSGCINGYVGINNSIGFQVNEFNNHDGDFSENASCNYVSTFNGTSSAAPSVAGVVALMLEANGDLTWRDVKHILATTSIQVDASNTYTLSGIVQYEWETNAAGFTFHNWYGFGKINAAEAVNTAVAYTADSRGVFNDTGYVSAGVIDAEFTEGTTVRSLNVTKPVDSNNFTEFVRVSVQFDHAVPKTVGIRLQSPQGTVVNILQPFTNIETNPSGVLFDIGVSAFYGEEVEGDWIIGIDDYDDDAIDGTLIQWGIQVYGN